MLECLLYVTRVKFPLVVTSTAIKPQTDLRKAENWNHKKILPVITKF